MRKTLLFLGLAVALLFGSASGQPGVDVVYLTADSAVEVVGDVFYMEPLGGGDLIVGVHCTIGQPIAALSYPFVEICGVADLDSFKNDRTAPPICMVGGAINLIGWGAQVLNLNSWPPKFLLGGVAVTAPSLPVGDHMIAQMRFTMPPGATDTCICLDTLFFPPSSVLQHVDEAAVGYTPNWYANGKCFDVLRRPNTPPAITCEATADGFTVLPVTFSFSAVDGEDDPIVDPPTVWIEPDCGTFGAITGDPTDWTVTFDPTTGTPCGAGSYTVYYEVCDIYGGCDTCETALELIALVGIVEIESLTGDDCVFPGDVVELSVMLTGYVPFGGFKLYVEYDPTVMTKLSVERGDLIDDFEGYYDDYNHVPMYFFQYFNERQLPCGQQCETYKIKIVGIADMPDGVVNGPLRITEGAEELIKLRFLVARDANLHDLFLPVKFEFDYDFDQKAPSFSDPTGNILYVDQNNPIETSEPNLQILKMIKFVDGGVLVCSDAFCWTGDINMNEYPYEIADAVLFANYFLYGTDVFVFDPDIQVQATDVNQDGFVLSMSDFVFLVRIILEDISPKHKLAPSSELANVNVVTQGDAVRVISNSSTAIGAGLYVFKHSGEVKNLTLHADMNMKYADQNGELRVLVYNFEGKSIAAGMTDLFSFEAKEVELVEVNAADFYGSALKSTITVKVLPTKFALMNNYPNPFNLSTSISFALPVDSKVGLKLYNIAGQLVKAYEGQYEAGNHTINWDGTNTKGATVASGIYFYKLVAGDYSCTKKMVLTK
jgi:hypothetical protein